MLSVVICSSCRNQSIAFDNTWDYALNFSYNDNGELTRMLDNFLKEETISSDYYCSKCKGNLPFIQPFGIANANWISFDCLRCWCCRLNVFPTANTANRSWTVVSGSIRSWTSARCWPIASIPARKTHTISWWEWWTIRAISTVVTTLLNVAMQSTIAGITLTTLQ